MDPVHHLASYKGKTQSIMTMFLNVPFTLYLIEKELHNFLSTPPPDSS